jgi:uncharacterized protein involved in exopolysaccharide biosynthesis
MLNSVFPLSRTPVSYRMPPRPSLRAIGQILKLEWRLIAACALCSVLIGTLYCLITPKLYEASIQIVPGDFTTKSTNGSAAGLATLLLSAPSQSDSVVKRFVTVLYSPDLASRLVMQNHDSVLEASHSGWLSKLFGATPEKNDAHHRILKVESALGSIQFVDNKKTLATLFSYRSTSPKQAGEFLKLAITEGDELLRQYNLSEIRYDDAYLNNTIGNAQNVDVRMALAQKLVETQLRRMDAQRSEYFSVRTLGPVEVSEGPVWPRKKLILPGMLILGVLIGGIAAFTRVYSRNREQEDGLI